MVDYVFRVREPQTLVEYNNSRYTGDILTGKEFRRLRRKRERV